MIRRGFIQNKSANGLLLVLLWIVVSFGLRESIAFAQVVEANATEEETEEENDELEDFEENEELEELFEIRNELQGDLKQLQQAAKDTQRRIQMIDEFVALLRKADQLETKIEQAENINDDLADKLQSAFDRIETELATKEELLELEHELAEFEEAIEEAEAEEDDQRRETLESLVIDLKTIRSISEKLLPIYLDGPESAEAKLEQEKAKAFTRVEKAYRALDVIEQLHEAEEAEDEELIKELEQKLRELESKIDANPEATKPAEKLSKSPEMQPILVNKETLAPFRNADLQRDVAPLLRKYCFECHSNDSSSGELNVEKLLSESPIVKHREMWINVVEQAKNHVMPPEDGQQPSLDDRRRIVLSLHHAVHSFDYSGIRDPGFEAARRMTHREYSNTVRDLFGIKIDVVDRFPDDLTATSGFDNSANSLFIQPLLMERYLGIAEFVVARALPKDANSPEEKAAHERIFARKPRSNDDVMIAARDVFTRFLLRAFRRPPNEDEVDRYVRQVVRAVNRGTDYEAAVKASLQTVLISPSFLLLTENDRPDEPVAYAISDWELASRLSYFIWASMPDGELFELASANRLSDKAILIAQAHRMIEDRKADTLGSVFVAQWLGSQHLGVRLRPDPIDNPWCTDSLMKAMRNESSMFFNSLVRENRPITELIDANYTFLNEELAKFYRIKGVSGAEMRRVQLENNSQRGGIFAQGSLLAITSFPHRTSPVMRGKWILDNVLGTPPPPPPPNVSQLSEEIEDNRRLSFREKLELHRNKPNCYACHSQMDPMGFSLEQFDWFGRYRTRRGRKRIDATGVLPNGTQFAGLAGLKQVIIQQRHDDLVRQVSQKMLSYALGRQLDYYDEPAIRKIVDRVVADDDRMQTLVREIVMSFPFQFKQNRVSAGAANTEPTVNLLDR